MLCAFAVQVQAARAMILKLVLNTLGIHQPCSSIRRTGGDQSLKCFLVMARDNLASGRSLQLLQSLSALEP